MNLEKKNWFESASWHTIYLTILFIITAVILYFALPQEGRFPYEFQKGRPWMHATLIAPYNFAIEKSDETISIERDSLLKSLTLIHISEPTRLGMISYAVFCLKKKKK